MAKKHTGRHLSGIKYVLVLEFHSGAGRIMQRQMISGYTKAPYVMHDYESYN